MSFYVLYRSLDNVGLISCRICFVLMEREYSSMTQHYFRVHGISHRQMVAKYGLEQTESDVAATRNMEDLACPACEDRARFAGLRDLRDHYEAVHGWNIVWIGKLLREVADRSEVVTACGRCVNTVAKDRLEEHWKLCGSSIFTSNKDFSKRFALKKNRRRKRRMNLTKSRSATATSQDRRERAVKKGECYSVECPLCNISAEGLEALKKHFESAHRTATVPWNETHLR